MKKETILAKLRVSLSLTPVGLEWLVPRQSLETQDSEGRYFFRQYSETWNSIVSMQVEEGVRDYFVELGTPAEYLPHVQVYESYLGSWIIEAAIVMSASVGTAYAILKSVSELPQIADGLEELKTRLKNEVNGAANETAREVLPVKDEAN